MIRIRQISLSEVNIGRGRTPRGVIFNTAALKECGDPTIRDDGNIRSVLKNVQFPHLYITGMPRRINMDKLIEKIDRSRTAAEFRDRTGLEMRKGEDTVDQILPAVVGRLTDELSILRNRYPSTPMLGRRTPETIVAGAIQQLLKGDYKGWDRDKDCFYTYFPGIQIDLSGAVFNKGEYFPADLSGVILTGAELSGIHLKNANLTGAQLQYADLSRSWATMSRFTNANLSHSDMRSMDLRGADLTGALLKDADMKGSWIDEKWEGYIAAQNVRNSRYIDWQ